MLCFTAAQLRPVPKHQHSGVLRPRVVIDLALYNNIYLLPGLTSRYASSVTIEFGPWLPRELMRMLFVRLGAKGQQTRAMRAAPGDRCMLFCESRRGERDFWHLELFDGGELQFFLDRETALDVLRDEYDRAPRSRRDSFDDYARREIASRLVWLLRRVQRCLGEMQTDNHCSFLFLKK